MGTKYLRLWTLTNVFIICVGAIIHQRCEYMLENTRWNSTDDLIISITDDSCSTNLDTVLCTISELDNLKILNFSHNGGTFICIIESPIVNISVTRTPVIRDGDSFVCIQNNVRVFDRWLPSQTGDTYDVPLLIFTSELTCMLCTANATNNTLFCISSVVRIPETLVTPDETSSGDIATDNGIQTETNPTYDTATQCQLCYDGESYEIQKEQKEIKKTKSSQLRATDHESVSRPRETKSSVTADAAQYVPIISTQRSRIPKISPTDTSYLPIYRLRQLWPTVPNVPPYAVPHTHDTSTRRRILSRIRRNESTRQYAESHMERSPTGYMEKHSIRAKDDTEYASSGFVSCSLCIVPTNANISVSIFPTGINLQRSTANLPTDTSNAKSSYRGQRTKISGNHGSSSSDRSFFKELYTKSVDGNTKTRLRRDVKRYSRSEQSTPKAKEAISSEENASESTGSTESSILRSGLSGTHSVSTILYTINNTLNDISSQLTKTTSGPISDVASEAASTDDEGSTNQINGPNNNTRYTHAPTSSNAVFTPQVIDILGKVSQSGDHEHTYITVPVPVPTDIPVSWFMKHPVAVLFISLITAAISVWIISTVFVTINRRKYRHYRAL
nr:membrane protein m121 [Mastomys natalensis cytomegalovirus 3]WEG69943.1 membrane protein m121 [Mastomys natalensis cytomegalovirus 3]WEG70083.1 membrane protein m121 [Mastomys natalensis cytomegalovirus 3]WEG70223.1 membrane protein m121 [Mastomys natalensis cytomegalovirus 3]WEG70363.1 membrane protein m121 [Mastomys natalensis cytomegalovirus 3]